MVSKFEAYLLTEKRVSPNTFDAYKRDMHQFTNFLNSQKKTINEATEQDLKHFLAFLKKNNCSARTVSRKISTLKLFYDWLSKNADLKNITGNLVAPKMQKKLPTFLTEQEIERLFATVPAENSHYAERNKIMLYLLYASGMRITELIQIKISDFHFETGFIAIKGKGNKNRLIPLPEEMLELIKLYIQKKSKKEQTENDFLFSVNYGKKVKHISRQSFWLILKKLCICAGIKKNVSPHTLRHSLATHLLKKGAHLRTLQLLLGHEHLATVQVYTHLETSFVRSIYDKKHPRA